MKLIHVVCALVALYGTAFSATIYVPDNFPTIQNAINASVNGDTVIVRPGTYLENIDFVGKAVTVTSEKGAEETTIARVTNGISIVTFKSGEGTGSVLNGFRITNGICDRGGGIRCIGSSPSLTNNIIVLNEAHTSDGRGGGIYCRNSDPLIRHNIIESNFAWGGAGIYCEMSSPVIDGNLIFLNQAMVLDAKGGSGGPAGSRNRPQYRTAFPLRSHAGTGGKMTVWGLGGGIYCTGGRPLIVGNRIVKNDCAEAGAGIYCGKATVFISGNTIDSNRCFYHYGGGGICCDESNLTVVNTILWGNHLYTWPEIWITMWRLPSICKISYSDVDGGHSSCWVEPGCTLDWGSGMINADPLYADRAGNDLHLTWPSPCRNTGDSSAVVGHYDFEGDPRVVDTVDMGADEFYYHLYSVGDVLPGASITIKVVGIPGLPALLALGTAIQDPPFPTPQGKLWLKLPLAKSWLLGSIPGDGIRTHDAPVPSGWPSGSTHPFQALVGPWGCVSSSLTNLHVLTVK